jgi:hypothetical protein
LRMGHEKARAATKADYVDDLLISVKSVDQAIRKCGASNATLAAGFPI